MPACLVGFRWREWRPDADENDPLEVYYFARVDWIQARHDWCAAVGVDERAIPGGWA